MSTKNVPQPKYRIEERGWPNGCVPAVELADREQAIHVFDAIVRTSRRLHAARPELRVVLLGPDRSTR
jgi:hypothetical protein